MGPFEVEHCFSRENFPCAFFYRIHDASEMRVSGDQLPGFFWLLVGSAEED